MNEMYEAQLKRAQRVKDSHPYIVLEKGPTVEPCPIHSSNIGMILSVDNSYWTDYPMKEDTGCRCRVRQISQREYERMVKDKWQTMISSEKIQELIYTFLQTTFKQDTFNEEKLDLNIEEEMFMFLDSEFIDSKSVQELPRSEQYFIFELLSQYMVFLTMHSHLTFPSIFLNGFSEKSIGKEMLGYIYEHKWPFPQMIKD